LRKFFNPIHLPKFTVNGTKTILGRVLHGLFHTGTVTNGNSLNAYRFQIVKIHTTGLAQHRKTVSYEVYNSSNTSLEYVREDFFLQGLQNRLDVDLYMTMVWLSQHAKQQNCVQELQNTWKWKVIFSD